MIDEYPEITSFGTLLKFALALEAGIAELATRAAAREDCRAWEEPLQRSARKHARRAVQLERLRRERLNEVVLQQVAGISGATYLPARELPADPTAALAAVAAAEERAAAFYADAARVAHRVLGGLERSFTKLGSESAALGAALRARTSR